MNITIICDVLGEANNGTSLAAFNLIRHLKSKGHNVTVVAPDAPDEEGFVSVPSLDLTFMLNWALRLNDVVLAKPDKQLLADAIRDADVVHLLVPLPLSVAAVKIAKEMDKPVTASFHCQAENVTAHFGLMDFSLANNATYEAFYKLVYQLKLFFFLLTCSKYTIVISPCQHFFINLFKNSFSEIIGTPSCIAFTFLLLFDIASLLIR